MMAMIRDAQGLVEGQHGLTLSFHPHVLTAVEYEDQIDRMLDETGIALCFDTGHHAFRDQDALAYMDRVFDRIAYMHLKNVDDAVRARVRAGTLAPADAYDAGIMCPLPDGVVDVRAVMRLLDARGFGRAGRRGAGHRRERDGESRGDLARRNLDYLRGIVLMAAIRVGLIGLGEVAQLMHLPLLADDPRFEIVAVTDASPSLAAAMAKRYGVPRVHRKREALIERRRPRPRLHPGARPPARASARRRDLGRPACFRREARDAERRRTRAHPRSLPRAPGQVVFIGYMRRYSRPFLELKRRRPATFEAIRHVRVRDVIREAPFFVAQTRRIFRADDLHDALIAEGSALTRGRAALRHGRLQARMRSARTRC